MAHITVSVEYAIHCLLWLIGQEGTPMSTRKLAEVQGISPSFLAKIFPKLERGGIVRASEGVRGGYLLAKPPKDISFLAIVDAIEGEKPLFDCREIRAQCPLFGKDPPTWATKGRCAIHSAMLRAEKSMRDTLKSQSLADVAQALGRRAPPEFWADVKEWIDGKDEVPTRKRAATQKRKRRRTP